MQRRATPIRSTTLGKALAVAAAALFASAAGVACDDDGRGEGTVESASKQARTSGASEENEGGDESDERTAEPAAGKAATPEPGSAKNTAPPKSDDKLLASAAMPKVAEPPPAAAKVAAPPTGPDLSAQFAAALGNVALTPVEGEAVREGQVKAGDAGVFLPEARWGERAQAVMDLVDSLEAQGVSESRLTSALLDNMVTLREHLLEWPGWTGDPAKDVPRAQLVAQGEFQLARLWLEAIRALKHDHSAMPPFTERDMALRMLGSVMTWEPAAAAVAALRPASEQYEPLMKSLAWYRDVAAKGGFTKLPEDLRKAKPHREHEAIPLLRKRLVEEGATLEDTTSKKWDQALTDALRSEREFRQLRSYKKCKRNIDKRFIAILNVSPERRIAKLKLNLERWRTSDFNHFDYKVFINLPDFHGEVWDGPEQLMRFKTVVGSTKIERGHRINATPRLTARIKRVVYNPTWTVPGRIIHEELIPGAEKKIEKEGLETTPLDYLRSKGYTVWNEDNPRKMRMRRAPGPDNALGKVKIQFDNRYFVYLHDTNLRSKFQRQRRALSHGCMRVHKPLKFSQLLLERDGSFWKVDKLRVMHHRKETPIYFKTTIPVVVDYISARVGADGRTRFLWDMYRYDAPRLAALTPKAPKDDEDGGEEDG